MAALATARQLADHHGIPTAKLAEWVALGMIGAAGTWLPIRGTHTQPTYPIDRVLALARDDTDPAA